MTRFLSSSKSRPDRFSHPSTTTSPSRYPMTRHASNSRRFACGAATPVNARALLNESGDPVPARTCGRAGGRRTASTRRLVRARPRPTCRGDFKSPGCPSGICCNCSAFSPQAASVEYVAFTTEDTPNEELLELRIDQAGASTITGQVRDPEGSARSSRFTTRSNICIGERTADSIGNSRHP